MTSQITLPDLGTMRRYRLDRVRRQLRASGCNAVLLFDPVNIRYATDCPNMQVWTLHNPARYVMVIDEGPMILWEFHGAEHLGRALPLIDEVRPSTAWFTFAAGSQGVERARLFATEIADVLRRHVGRGARLAVDRIDTPGTFALLAEGLTLHDGQALLEHARVIKSPDEIAAMHVATAVCETGIARMRAALAPGITENALWSHLHQANIELGGEWIMTRLLASGPRTNPWYQECSDRRIEAGDLVSFDTDLVGPYGYVCDMSRAWVCGARPTAAQRDLLSVCRAQIEHNLSLLRPGIGTREIAARAFVLPERYRAQQYGGIVHGVGLGDERPCAVPGGDADGADDEILEAGMTVSLESYAGLVGGPDGLKLEEQVLITETGWAPFSTYPVGETWA